MQFSLKETEKSIFAIVVPSRYDRAMLFCRAQEYYESPNPDFQGKHFSIWDYMKWYAHETKKGFTYPMDWSGFNIPLDTIEECYSQTNPFRLETPYDQKMMDILDQVKTHQRRYSKGTKGYVIGTDSLTSETFLHETKHAKYMSDPIYKAQVLKALNRLKKNYSQEYKLLCQNILAMGYAQSVVEDEIQAYLQDKSTDSDVRKGIDNTRLKEIKITFASEVNTNKNIKSKEKSPPLNELS